MAEQIAPRKRRVFESVFTVSNISQPTPVTTPASGFTTPGQAFGSPFSGKTFPAAIPDGKISGTPVNISLNVSEHVSHQVQWDRSWHTVTHKLKLPDFPENRGILEPLQPERESLGREFYDSLETVLYPQVCLPFARQTEDILAWHTSQVQQHFLHQVLPLILQLRDLDDSGAVLFRGVKILETAHRQYLHALSFIKEQIDLSAPGTSLPPTKRFHRDLHAIVSNSAIKPLSNALTKVLRHHVASILGLPSVSKAGVSRMATEGPESDKARRELLGLVECLKNVELTGEAFQAIFAEVMNNAMKEYVFLGCRSHWSQGDATLSRPSTPQQRSTTVKSSILPRTVHHSSPSQCVTDLCEWIENRFAKLAVQVLSMLNTKAVKVTWADVEKFKEMSIGCLADLRINELFGIASNWPQNRAALDDLRTSVATPQRRLHLTEAFAETLSGNLLHPGASTIHILRTYISMIWSFHFLDHSKVLLDRVAYPLQVYLCSREDTVRIIIAGMLSDTECRSENANNTTEEKLVELAQLLNSGLEQVGHRANDEDLDWHDMEWIPDPVDAGPGYKRSKKNADIIGTLIGVLGSQELFIKEFQNIIGENLLKHEGSFDKEIKVLELLKVRFGEAHLQACEVMIKDIQDSGRVNSVVRKNQKLDPSEQEMSAASRSHNMPEENINPEGLLKPSLHAKILSRLYWPQLQDQSYQIPKEIAELQVKYEEGFEALKASRKLTWLHSLGQALVELELEDRTVKEEVHTWQATVIWAFQAEDGTSSNRAVGELVQLLDMEESLVRSALTFWVHKLVLREVSSNVFAVMETLNQEDLARSNAQAPVPSPGGVNDEAVGGMGQGASEGITDDKMGMYWKFIQGMLTNSSSQMPLQQIAMMLKMLVVDGFPYSNEELQEFLGGKVANGSLELNGGKYRLKK